MDLICLRLRKSEKRGGRVLLCLSPLRTSDQAAAQDEDVRGATDVGDHGNISEIGVGLPEQIIDKNGIEPRALVVPALFRTSRYINYKTNLPRNSILEAEWLKKPRKNNVQLMQSGSPSSPEEFV